MLLPIAHKTRSTVFDVSDEQLYSGLHTIFCSQSLLVLIIQIGELFGQESSPLEVKLAIEISASPRPSFDGVVPQCPAASMLPGMDLAKTSYLFPDSASS